MRTAVVVVVSSADYGAGVINPKIAAAIWILLPVVVAARIMAGAAGGHSSVPE
jgi:hypothetical protein